MLGWIIAGALALAAAAGWKKGHPDKGADGAPASPTPAGDKPAKPGKGNDAGKITALDIDARMRDLRDRAPKGAAWHDRMLKQGLSEPYATMLSRWFGIESGGNPLAKSSKGERGLAQASHDEWATYKGKESDWNAMGNTATSSDKQLALAEWYANKTINAGVRAALGQDYQALTNHAEDAMWLGKLYHELPQMVNELRDQGLIVLPAGYESDPSAKLRNVAFAAFSTASAKPYQPSAKVMSYSPDGTLAGLYWRFVIPADIVVDG